MENKEAHIYFTLSGNPAWDSENRRWKSKQQITLELGKALKERALLERQITDQQSTIDGLIEKIMQLYDELIEETELTMKLLKNDPLDERAAESPLLGSLIRLVYRGKIDG